jgi:DNA polymerase III subunit delta'
MFDSLVGNSRAKDVLRGMLRRGKVPGALLFAGPGGVGKRLFALQLAKGAVCRDLRDGEACDVCPACLRVEIFNPPKESDKDANKKLTRTSHPDVALARTSGRNIPVDQIRELEREAQFRPFEARARFYVVDDADKMNDQASNALLKTLEEPSSTTHIVLITARPAVLLDTIRSRSQLVRFIPIEPQEIKNNLTASGEFAPGDVNLLTGIAAGSLGRARAMDLEHYRQQRELMLDAISAASIGHDRARLLRVAQELSDPKLKEEYESYLDILETLAIDVLHLSVDSQGGAIVNDDLRRQLRTIAEAVSPAAASAWVQQIESLRATFKVNVNRKVASDALFLGMMVTA